MKKLFNTVKSISFVVVLVALVLLVGCNKVSNALSKDASPVDPTSIKYDGKTFTWSQAENATKYKIVVNSLSPITVTGTTYGYSAKTTDSTVTVTITSVSSSDKEAESAARTFTRLDKVTNITFDIYGVMSWDDVPNATSYLVNINGKETEVATTQFDEFVVGTNNIQVRAITSDGSTFSEYSQVVKKTFLAAPTNIKYDGSLLSWNGSGSYATNGYEVYINNALYETTQGSGTSLRYEANSSTFEVYVIALGDVTATNRSVFSSKESETVTFTYLPAISQINVVNGELVWEEVEGAQAYEIKLNGTPTTTTEPKKAISAGTRYDVQIKAILKDGSTFFSDYSATKSVYVLRNPEILWNDSYDLSDGVEKENIYWDTVIGDVNGYTVKVVKRTVNGNDEQEYDFDATQKSFRYAFGEVGDYEVSVKAVADKNAGNYDSAYSTPIYVTRCAAPRETGVNYITSTPDNLKDGFTVSFMSVSGAQAYQLYKEGSTINGQLSTNTQIVVKDIVEENNSDAATINYAIQTVGKGLVTAGGKTYVYLSSLRSQDLTFQIYVLSTPTHVEYNGYNITWDANVNATSYGVKTSTVADSGTSSYSLKNLLPGTYQISICSKGNGGTTLASNYTAPQKVTRLQAPTNIRVGTSANEGVLMWDDVLNANSYQVYFGNDDNPVDASTTDSIDQYISTAGTAVSMVAIANQFGPDGTYYVTSEHSQTVQLIKFTQPSFNQQAYIQNGKLHWNKPSNINAQVFAPSYYVYDQEHYKYNSEPQAEEFNLYESDMIGGNSYTLTVKAIGDGTHYINSAESDPISFFLLETPTVTRVDGGYQWRGVVNATQYVVAVDGVEVYRVAHTTAGADYMWEVDLSKFPNVNKAYTITVQAVSNAAGTVDSRPATLQQVVKKATTPEIATSYDHDYYDENGLITITVTKESNYKTGYLYSVGGSTAPQKTTDTSYSYCPHSIGKFTLKVHSCGGQFDSEGVLYLDSDDVTTQINLLAAPSNININKDGQISWKSVSEAIGYDLVITLSDDSVIEYHTTSVGVALSNPKINTTKENVKSIAIYACGNGHTIIASAAGVYVNNYAN